MDPDAVKHVTFYFDPMCPWTWRTSRWLVDVAGRHDIAIGYRAFELSDGASLDEVSEEHRVGAPASRRFLRAVESAHARGVDDIIGAIYTAYGTAVHDEGREPSVELVRQCVEDHGSSELLAALDDESLDATVAAARTEAQTHAGDDAGSPVLVLATAEDQRGFFGPVVAPTPTGAEADRLWDAVVTAASVPQFFEFKTRRATEP